MRPTNEYYAPVFIADASGRVSLYEEGVNDSRRDALPPSLSVTAALCSDSPDPRDSNSLPRPAASEPTRAEPSRASPAKNTVQPGAYPPSSFVPLVIAGRLPARRFISEITLCAGPPRPA